MSTGSLAERAALKRKEIERKIELRNLILPENDEVVVKALKKLRQVQLSTAEKRKEQLRQILYERKTNNLSYSIPEILKIPDNSQDDEEFWSLGNSKLLEFRRQLGHESLLKAKLRLESLRTTASIDIDVLKKSESDYLKFVDNLKPYSSFAIANRPITCIESHHISNNKIAIGEMSGRLQLCDMNKENIKANYESNEHSGRISDIQWHPSANLEEDVVHFLTAGNDGKIFCYNMETNDPFVEVVGHAQRCNRIRFLNRDYFATCGFDNLIKIWDYESMTCLLEQSGHSHSIYDISVHPDSSLINSGDLGGTGRLWDIRTGRSLHSYQSQKGILCSQFHPNGFWLFTGGEDGIIRIHDIRKLEVLYEIPAHTQSITKLLFTSEDAKNPGCLISSSFDRSIKFWSENDWQLLGHKSAHDGKITSLDWKNNRLLSGGFDRKIKLWSIE
eukprot:NODE_246_length_11841_cov_1.234032.p5 type:complete len:446 gc:universal NODE_246_length_11841_cov_1.234032:2261-3598(+)